MRYRHLIDLNELKKQQWEAIVDLAVSICDSPQKYSTVCNGKILATLFYEPSTRTQMSFQTAMIKLGGQIIGFDNPQNSSVSKGENLVDTIKVVSGYADIIAMRHPVEGSALAGALYADCSIINAGDGGHLHPTQTLTDLVTLKHEIGSIDNITIGLCGDLKYGRTVHSLIKALCCYHGIKFVLISTDTLPLPNHFKKMIDDSQCTYTEITALEEALPLLDVLYMTRIQKERFASQSLYESQKDIYILDAKKLRSAKPNLKIMHPLPRIDEISLDVDSDPRAIYFDQAKYGVYARMALIITLLKGQIEEPLLIGNSENLLSISCKNPNCVTNSEHYLENSFISVDGRYICEYCDFECK